MQNIYQRLLSIPSESFLVMCIQEMIIKKGEDKEVLSEIKSIAADNPPMMARALGAELFNEILNTELC